MRNNATIADLYKEPGKAELVNGTIIRYPADGHRPSRITCQVLRSLADYADDHGGEVFTGSLAYTISRLNSGRESFSPDASYYVGPLPANPMHFIAGPPTFAVEVRSENDYGPAAERAMAAKRADYFEAGTQVVWDADPVANVIRSYRASSPDSPVVFGPGSQADAEPAVPGWTLSVDWAMS